MKFALFQSRRMKWLFAFSSLCVLSLFIVSCGSSGSSGTSTPPVLNLRSSLAHRVSGGTALLEVTLPADAISSDVFSITVNGVDASANFKPTATPNLLSGLITGLNNGDNLVVAKVGNAVAPTLTLTNYPITGPISSGPWITPYICQTDTLLLPDGTKLVPTPNDPNCSAQTNVQYQYKNTAGVFKPLTNTASLPSDVVNTTTTAGLTVPYVVRVETTTIDRGMAQIAILFDPTKDAAPTPLTPPKNWNQKLIYGHGTGCVGGWFIQGGVWGYSPMNDTWLSRGYAVANNTLNHPTNSCNMVLSAEAASMTKEYFIKRFGAPKYTISTGTSGGAIASLQQNDAFPGLFDGALIDATFPDVLTIANTASDAHLLSNYFASSSPIAAKFTPAQKTAISGYASEISLYANGNQMGRTDPVPNRAAPTFPGLANYASAVWNAAVPVSMRYDPNANPPLFTGARPTIYDIAGNVYGRATNPLDPSGKSKYGLRAYDNTGVQYGLAALNSGAITMAQFLDINANAGGFDTDANPVPSRSVGNADAISRAYQSGLLMGGNGGLSSVPIFDLTNIYGEDTTNYHMQWYHFAARERILQANGNTDNHVMWRGNIAALSPNAIVAFEKWMDAIAADKSNDALRVKTIRAKPAEMVDGCFDNSVPPKFIAEKQVLGSSGTQCNTLWPSYPNPRLMAGGPLAANILKCQLKPIDLNDYKVSVSASDLRTLATIFPSGVCDWSKTGVNQKPVVTWASFGPSKVNLVYDSTAN